MGTIKAPTESWLFIHSLFKARASFGHILLNDLSTFIDVTVVYKYCPLLSLFFYIIICVSCVHLSNLIGQYSIFNKKR